MWFFYFSPMIFDWGLVLVVVTKTKPATSMLRHPSKRQVEKQKEYADHVNWSNGSKKVFMGLLTFPESVSMFTYQVPVQQSPAKNHDISSELTFSWW